MDDKKLRKISKKELLEILLSQAKRIEELELELKKTKDKLESKKVAINEVGSIAEASLKLNGIFEVAQLTADQYLMNVKDKCKKLENATKKKCQKKEQEADEYLAQILEKTKELTKPKGKKVKKNTEKTNPKKTVKGKTRKVIKKKGS